MWLFDVKLPEDDLKKFETYRNVSELYVKLCFEYLLVLTIKLFVKELIWVPLRYLKIFVGWSGNKFTWHIIVYIKVVAISGELVHQRVSRVHRVKQNLSGCTHKTVARWKQLWCDGWTSVSRQQKISSHDMKHPLCDGNSVKELCDSNVNKSELF